jgi:hypothetical protein
MKLRIVAHTQFGAFKGQKMIYTEKEVGEIKKLVADVCDTSGHFSFPSEDGKLIYLAKEVCHNCVFELEIESE